MAITTNHLEELMEEVRDSDESILESARKATEIIRNSQHLMVLTGAGISTSAGISCYRGPEGVWTCQAQGRPAPRGTPMSDATPTLTHMGLVALQNKGVLKHLGSQNIDGLHIRSGIPLSNITEVHGNLFKERCPQCSSEWIGQSITYHGSLAGDVAAQTCTSCHGRGLATCHCTGNTCPGCGSPLQDTVINFGENLRPEHLDMLFAHAAASDVCLVLGTSLAVRPFNDIPRDVKAHGGRVIIVNLQRTPLDSLCDNDGVRMFCETDGFMRSVLEALDLPAPTWQHPAGLPTVKQIRRQCDVEQELAALYASTRTPSAQTGGGFCVNPSSSCVHAATHCGTILGDVDLAGPCSECGKVGENWLCGQCQTVHCGRYVCGHMVRHAHDGGHWIGFSLADSSVWCFACDSYVDEGAVPAAQPLYQQLYHRKHGEWDPRPMLRSAASACDDQAMV